MARPRLRRALWRAWDALTFVPILAVLLVLGAVLTLADLLRAIVMSRLVRRDEVVR